MKHLLCEEILVLVLALVLALALVLVRRADVICVYWEIQLVTNLIA